MPAPPYSSGIVAPSRPSSAISGISSAGKRAWSKQSPMIGSTLSSTKRATESCTMRSSSESSARTSYKSRGLSGGCGMGESGFVGKPVIVPGRGARDERRGASNLGRAFAPHPPSLIPDIRHSMRHVPRRHVAASRLDIDRRIVEEQVRAERLEERSLVAATEEQGLIDAHPPPAQRQDHALVRGRRARGDQRGADRRILGRKGGLQTVQRGEEIAERSARERFVPALGFVAVERIEPLLL